MALEAGASVVTQESVEEAKALERVHPSQCFIDATLEGINIRPRDLERSKQKHVRLQTDKISLLNRRLQSFETKDMDVQTASPADMVGVVPEVDEDALVAFLAQVSPEMERELDLAWHSVSVFDAYEPLWDDMVDTCEVIHQLSKFGAVDLNITSVAWNTTGSVLACALGKLETLGWCDSNAPVCLWNIFRPNLSPTQPDIIIHVQAFVRCLAFHPTQPAVFVGGTYNGELMIWNTSSNDLDPLVASSSIDDYYHREAIEAVEWISADLSGGADAYLIATVSGDGKVLIWDARENDLSYPSRGFMILGSKKRVLGGRSMSFSPLDPWLFVVGCEMGAVMRAFRPPPGASMGKPQGQYSWKPSAVALLDQLAANSRLQLQHHVETFCRTHGKKEVTPEVVFQSKPDPTVIFPAAKTTDLESHAGPVIVAIFSPFYRKLLLTGSVDGSVKIYDVLQQKAIQSFFPPSKRLSTCAVSAAAWSSSRPCVFAVAMEAGGVYMYDLMQSRQEPVLQLPLAASGSQCITSLAFNPKQRGLIAVGDDTGRVRVFRLPFKLSMQRKDELPFISMFMNNAGSAMSK